MVKASELDDPWRGPGIFQHRGAGGAVRAAAVKGPAQLDARRFVACGRDVLTQKDVGNAVPPALMALADVMKEGGCNQVGVGVTSLDEPASGAGGVHDVSRVLGGEQVEQGRGEELPRKGEVGLHGFPGSEHELPDSLSEHHTSRSKIVSLMPPMRNPMGEYCGTRNPITIRDIRMPGPHGLICSS